MPVRQGSPLDTLGVTLSLVEGSGHPDQRRGVRRAGAPVVLIAALVCTPPGVLCAQEISPGPARQEQAIVFRAGVEVVTLTAAVRDGRGRVVRDLKRSDFQVLDTGIAQDIRDFHSGDAPISLAVLLDISGSMAVGGNMDRARHAVAVAMGMLTGGDDEAALFTFDAKLQEVVSFTKNLDAVRRVSLEGRPWGMTSLYDAIAAAAKSVAERANRHRALLVITDGADSGSRLSAPEVSGIASSIDVPVYLLTVVTPLDHPRRRVCGDPDRQSDVRARNPGRSVTLDGRGYEGGERPGAHG